MKRICSILLALCAFAACFTWLAACSRTFVTEYTVNTDYDALDSGRIVLGGDGDGGPQHPEPDRRGEALRRLAGGAAAGDRRRGGGVSIPVSVTICNGTVMEL